MTSTLAIAPSLTPVLTLSLAPLLYQPEPKLVCKTSVTGWLLRSDACNCFSIRAQAAGRSELTKSRPLRDVRSWHTSGKRAAGPLERRPEETAADRGEE